MSSMPPGPDPGLATGTGRSGAEPGHESGHTIPDPEAVAENGRTWHGYKDGKYFLPNDADEQDRLDFQHALWRLMMKYAHLDSGGCPLLSVCAISRPPASLSTEAQASAASSGWNPH
jgi:hypothetical protein